MDDLAKTLKGYFLDEASQRLDECEKYFLDLESGQDEAAQIEKIFGVIHNLKGASGAAGFQFIAEFTHALEALLLKLKKQGTAALPETVSLLLECNDFLRAAISSLKKDIDAEIENRALLEKISSHKAQPKKDPMAAAVTAELTGDAEAVPPKKFENENFLTEVVPVRSARLEKLNNLVGELVVLQSIVNQHAESVTSMPLLKTISQLNKIIKEIQSTAMACRMVPVRQVFLRLHRIARDTGVRLNKKVNVHIEGEGLEVDKTIVEHLFDPLIHIVRNAVDHGLESCEARRSEGKPEVGTLQMRALQKGDRLIIEIEDDGAGLDFEAIEKKSRELGLIGSTQKPTPAEVYQLILRPGFTTKTLASDISGRGLGLSIVKETLDRFSGDLWVESTAGKGTKFCVQFPLTLAIAEGMIIAIGNERYVVPLDQIDETVRIESSMVHDTSGGRGRVLALRGEVLPLVRLNDILRIDATGASAAMNLAIVFRNQRSAIAFAVDDVIRRQQIVMKQLGPEIPQREKFIGCAILGDGRPTLILDLNEFARVYARNGGNGSIGPFSPQVAS